MALKTSLRPIARKIAQAVKQFAVSKGLGDGDYALVGTFNETTERISLSFGTDRAIDELEYYSGILQAIRDSFPGYRQITMNIGLVVQQVPNLDDIYLGNIVTEDEVDLTEWFERA